MDNNKLYTFFEQLTPEELNNLDKDIASLVDVPAFTRLVRFLFTTADPHFQYIMGPSDVNIFNHGKSYASRTILKALISSQNPERPRQVTEPKKNLREKYKGM